MQQSLRLGTRGSPLALVQAGLVRAALIAAHGLADSAIEIVALRTSGDRIQDRPLAEIGGKALWTKELDRALFDREIDFAVHSMKDVETIRPPEIVCAAMLPRADVRDRLIGAASIEALPAGSRVGTASPRRAAQVRRLRPDLSIVPFRGNVATRLDRLDRGEADVTLLAAAGLDRLGHGEIGASIPLETMLPAPSQGAVGIETLRADRALVEMLAGIDDAETSRCVRAERALLEGLGADCRSPVAALATIVPGGIRLRAEILSEDGARHVAGEALLIDDVEASARLLARGLLARADPELAALFAA